MLIIISWSGLFSRVNQFNDLGNGVIQDRNSGLFWQKCSYGQNIRSSFCGGLAESLEWVAARKHCARLQLAQKKWRLPTLNEIQSLALENGEEPAIELNIFPGTVPYQYWTRSYYMDNHGTWIYVYSFTKNYKFAVRKGKFYVRCVSVSPRKKES